MSFLRRAKPQPAPAEPRYFNLKELAGGLVELTLSPEPSGDETNVLRSLGFVPTPPDGAVLALATSERFTSFDQVVEAIKNALNRKPDGELSSSYNELLGTIVKSA